MKTSQNLAPTLCILCLLCIFTVTAQLTPLEQQYDWVMPQLSPRGEVSAVLGVTEIKLKYHRPLVKKREIWGKLVLYGQVWRAGANEATTISFNTRVSIDGHELPAGTYSLFMLPGESEWEIIFNQVSLQWGAFTYDAKKDVLRVKVKPSFVNEHQEALEYRIDFVSNNTANVVLVWEKLRIPFSVSADVVELSKIKARTSFNAQSAFFAANYFYQGNLDLPEALRWANVAVDLEASYTNLLMKARILGNLGRYAEAIETAELGIEAAKRDKSMVPISIAEDLIVKWKVKINSK